MLAEKRGVSPLIATILLIAFAVALGSVVMNWGLHLEIGDNTGKCASVQIKLRNIDDNSEVCFGGFGEKGYINFVIDNVGREDINGLGITISGDKADEITSLDSIFIGKGQLYDQKDQQVKYDFNKFGTIRSVEFIPKVDQQGSLERCPKSAVIAKKVSICIQ